jgi:hypothetical protein
MSWAPLASDVPLDNAAQPAPDAATAPPAPSPPSDSQPAPQSPPAAPTGFTALPADAKLDGDAQDTAPAGLTPEEQRAVLDYLPKAKDAADLEQFAHDLTNGRASIGNAADVIAKRDQGHKQFSFENHVAPQINLPKDWRDKIGDAMIAGLSAQFPGLATFLQQARENGSGKAFTEHAANALVADYGPEVGGFLKTVADGGDLGTNIAHQRAVLTGDSSEHPVASIGGELTGAALAAPIGGEAVDAAGLSDIPSVAKAATGAAAYGSGAAGPGHRVAGAVEGAALGGLTDVAVPYIIKAIPAAGRAISDSLSSAPASPEALAAAKSASDLNITLPKFALSDADRAHAGALEQTAAGRGVIRAARTAMLDTSEAARSGIASDVGTAPETAAQLGDQTLDAAVKSNKARRNAISTLYDYANSASAGTAVTPAQTISTINSILTDENSRIGGSKIAPILQNVKDDLGQAGSITVDQARNLRTTLREQLTNEAGSTPSNADRITNQVMAAVNADMRNSLPSDAFNIYKQADTAWAQQRSLEDDVLKPFLGKDFDNWGDQVAAKINSDAKGNGTRLARFLSSLPEADANNVRASIITGLGKSKDGAQNAAGDAFSLNTFLTNWNQLSGARRLIFAPDTVKALDKLADVANVGKLSETARNHSNTGGILSRVLMGAGEMGGGALILSGHFKEGAIGLLASGLMAAKQYGAAKLLANPAFAKKLAATPLSPKVAEAFWNRPWVKELQLQNPTIAGEIQLFQNAVNDNFKRFSVSANSNTNEKPENQ